MLKAYYTHAMNVLLTNEVLEGATNEMIVFLIQDSWINANRTCSRGNMSLVDFKTRQEDEMIRTQIFAIPGSKLSAVT